MGPTCGVGSGLGGGIATFSRNNEGLLSVRFLNLGLGFRYSASDRISFGIKPELSMYSFASIPEYKSNSKISAQSGVGLLELSGFYGGRVKVGLKVHFGARYMDALFDEFVDSSGVFVTGSFLVIRFRASKW